MRKLVFLILLVSLIFPNVVFGQGEYQAVLLQPNIASFPGIDAFLDVHAPDGTFVHGLDPSSVQILEDNKNLPVESLQELRLGVQISIVINGAPSFTIRNNQGLSRFDTIRKLLEVWGASQKDIATDQLSLFTNSVVNQTNLTSSQSWLTALSTYQPDLKQAQPSLEPFSNAIQLGMDRQHTPPEEKAIFYFTPLPGEEMNSIVRDDLIDRAKKAGVRCFVWMIGAKNQFADPGAEQLRRIAEETGGQFFAFSGSEPLPELQSLIDPLRFLYQLHYISEVRQSGNHKAAVRVAIQDTATISLPVNFSIQLKPANPIFVSIPPTITRTRPKDIKEGNDQLQPASLAIEYLLEFPDGYPRDLVEATLLVDGEQAQQITSPPFSRFSWDLSDYDKTASHTLQVVVKDTFGFENLTAEVPIEVIVNKGTAGWLSDLWSSYWIFLVFLLVFLAGILAAFLYMKWRPRKQAASSQTKQGSESRLFFTPRSPQTEVNENNRAAHSTVTRTNSTASLHQLGADLAELDQKPIELGDVPQSWGSDQEHVDHWIDDAALEAIHTRIWRDHNGYYLIADQQTRLGTYVNHSPLDITSVTLMHGDLIQIGDLRYRFVENPPRSAWQVEVQLYN